MRKTFDRFKVKMKPLSERANKQVFSDKKILPDHAWDLDELSVKLMDETVERIMCARAQSLPVMLSFGAHAIKNCLAPVFINLLENGWITHLSTNGAGIIHDWEFAYQGKTSEDVQVYASKGQFGNWQETGFYINLAINVGAYEGLGYGESIGSLISNEGLTLPSEGELFDLVESRKDLVRSAAALDLLQKMKEHNLSPGWMSVPHKYKECSIQYHAYKLGIPFTGHPMIGHDIIYNHSMNCGAAIGRTAEKDFLCFAESVRQLDGGVYMSVGSAVMSPMVFEKSMSIGRNVALQEGLDINNHYILVVDLQKSHWDWTQGEPPESNPDYYLRYNKSFSRMGGQMRYMSADNRDFLLALTQKLQKNSN